MSNIEIPNSPSLNVQLANAVAALASAHEHLEHMRSLTAKARREEHMAWQRVEDAQRLFDALVAEVKKSAPRDTSWRQTPGIPV